MAWRFLLAGLLGGLCYLDRTAACQLMLHRPLVVSTIMGGIFGNFLAGAQVGAVLELIYLVHLPVGASLPPDDTGAAVFAGSAAAAIASGSVVDSGNFTALILLSVLFAELGKLPDRMIRKVNGRIARITRESVDRGDLKAVEHGLLAGLTLFAATGFLVSLLFSGAGIAVSKLLLPRFGTAIILDFTALAPVLPLIGAASVFTCGRTEKTAHIFFLSMAVAFGATVFYQWVV
jgi:mannose/fructose/N-acetylgalactosamine-specific phosphotransferase system component IIC